MEPSTPPLNQPDQPSGAPPVPATPPAAPVVPQPASQPLPAPAVPPVTPAAPPVAPPAPVSVPVAPVTDDFGKLQKIVIVEDNASLADIYSTRLTLLGYKCFVAYDGLAALATIQQEMPDLVLLDLMVPKIAGDQILETMRASSWGKDIKVQIISNLNEADAPAGLRAQGIEGYAVKANLSNDQLDQLVDNILKPAGQTEDIVLEAKEPPIQPLN